MIGEWANPWELTTPEGTLKLNYTDPASGQRFQLNPGKCVASLPVRSTEDDVPQGDGKIPHRRWRSGYGAHLAIEPLIAPIGSDPNLVDPYGQAEPACDADLVEMLDLLGLHLNAMIRTGLVSGLPNARAIWTPSGHPDRMLDRCQLLTGPIPNPLDGSLGGMQVEFDLDTPYPYYIEAAETVTTLYDGGTSAIEAVTNPGNTDYFAVLEVFGATGFFVVTNYSIVDLGGNPLEIVYNATLPGASGIGGGDHVEIVFFTGAAQLNGNQANRKAGIDYRYSEYFPLIPGENLLSLSGASGLLKSNGAWA